MIDEVAGQHHADPAADSGGGAASCGAYGFVRLRDLWALSLLNWKYLLAGFVLSGYSISGNHFPFATWKNFHGWGIMADDYWRESTLYILLKVALHFSVL